MNHGLPYLLTGASSSTNLTSTYAKSVKELYEFFEKLGEGAFCKVYRALYIPTNEIIAVKVNSMISVTILLDNKKIKIREF